MGKIIKTTLAEIAKQPISKRQQEALARFKNIRDEDIDFSDNPEATEEDFATGRVRLVARGGRRIGAGRKPANTKPVTVWLHSATISKMKQIAKRKNISNSAALESHLVWK